MRVRVGRSALLGILLLAGGCGGAGRAEPGAIVDLLVFAPHPDDETLGCAGILAQTLKRGERAAVAIFTNGDGFPEFASRLAHKPASDLSPAAFRDLARYRQEQSLAALRAVGGRPDDLHFLGYPDSGLDRVYETRGPEPYRQRFTGATETYGPSQPDDHTRVHGKPAPYTYDSVLGDVVRLLETLRPRRISVTGEADRHPDHRAAFRFVRDAVAACGYRGTFETYLIHGGPEWPWPLGKTPGAPLEAHDVKGVRVPQDVPWPPPVRVPLNAEEAAAKDRAVQAHMTHLAGDLSPALQAERVYLESFVKAEEVFWRVSRP